MEAHQVTTSIEELRLYARYDEGTGPVVVMLHGINMDGTVFRKVVDTMGPGYRYIVFDLLGFGLSPHPTDVDYSAEMLAVVMDNTLNDLGVDEPFLLVGYSLGGDLAIKYAAMYPQRLRRLFLLSAPFYLPPSAFSSKDVGIELVQATIYRWAWKRLAKSKDQGLLVYRLASGGLEKTLKGIFATEDLPTHWEIMSKYLANTINKATFIDDLPKLSMPTVFALGIRDPIVRPDQTPALKRLKPDMEIRRIVGLTADHMLLWNIPERIAAEILRDEIRELNVAWRGGSGAPLVLLHGIDSSSAQWQPAAEALSGSNDVAVIDLLGFGGSPAPLSSHYTLADQVAGVLGTVEKLWGPTAPVRYAGYGLGALVALGCAATAPTRSAGVIAFSPALLEPSHTFEELGAKSEAAARIVATREKIQRYATDERASSMSAEKVEARIVPPIRSLDYAIIGTDADALLSDVPAPVHFVVPGGDVLTPVGYLKRVAEAREGFDVATPEGSRELPLAEPAAAVREIEPKNSDAAALAQRIGPARVRKKTAFVDVVGGVENTMLRNGVLALALLVTIQLVHPLPDRLLALMFAGWVAFSAISTIIGAVGLKHSGKNAWIAYVLIGLVGIAFAIFVGIQQDKAMRLLSLVIAFYALYHGGSDIFVAWKIGRTAKPRWLLFLSGAVGIAAALAIFFAPGGGRNIVRIVLEVYLLATGVSLLAYALSVKAAARRRVRVLMKTD
jgi:pimeloyl-ACP methyl ester carboxylesterase/uncharacterized membrane protein HdeD (DUF308 family)